jgi:hypothetical protein
MNTIATYSHQPWNKGKLVGQKAPLRVRDIWAIRVRLQLAEKARDLALFNLAIDSKLNRPGFSRHSQGSLRNAFQTLPVTADC